MKLSWKTARPNSAITMSGVPATISMHDSITRESQVGRPYSLIHTAVVTASGSASTMPMSGQEHGAQQRVQETAAAGLVGGDLRPGEHQAGAQVLHPWTAK